MVRGRTITQYIHSRKNRGRFTASAGIAAIRDTESIDAATTLAPCITYECTADLVTTVMSPNVLDLIDIDPRNLVGTRLLWEERVESEGRNLLLSKLDQKCGVASAVHKIVNDNGQGVWVAHSVRRRKIGRKSIMLGSMIPLENAFNGAALDASTITQFVHKMGNHFQLINLVVGSLRRTGAGIDEVDALQQTVDRAVEFIRSFSNYAHAPAFAIGVDLPEVLRSAIATLAPLCAEKKLAVQEVFQESFSDTQIVGDPYLLELAFGAILLNAIEATTSGSQILITAKCEMNAASRPATVRISIADTGTGMEPDMLAKAADPFVTNNRDRDGLGLSTALRVIENHGGRLTLSSMRGQGTQVEIVVPISKDRGVTQCQTRS